MLWLTVSLFILQPIFIGFIAQRKKHRIGAVWFVVAFAVNIAFALFMDSAQRSRPDFHTPEYQALHAKPAYEIAFALSIFIPSTIALLIAIFTLPKRRVEGNSDDQPVTAGALKVCPDCAEQVKLEARKCRFCGHPFNDARLSDPAPL
ncbi:MAG: hypothetical protein J0J10_23345 [Bosea sp.]|uniref:zinc ribbon domain-containing protein n=1 Tax=Bosea sp. (in: a-proteobacteria) TaxID=1871050 RepID=UPI001AD23F5B|nr:zinc ribbon domain-containing protein [Bosea sp. (in: a-proteobacteria)]MBN9471709.1 hypothetical protein [Bosea sp. (in: a-proteobacteria)]